MDVRCMCINCHTNTPNKNESQSDLSDIADLNPPNDHHLKTSDLYRIEDIPEQLKNTGRIEVCRIKIED